MSDNARLSYETYCECLDGHRLPTAILNVDAFDQNAQTLKNYITGTGRKLRVATKSLRMPWAIKRLEKFFGENFAGLMCLTVEEAAFLVELGFEDILVAYPTINEPDLKLLAQLSDMQKKVRIIVDCKEHLEAISKAGSACKNPIEAVVEVDMSYRPVGDKVHLGVRRSPIRTGAQVLELAEACEKLGHVKIVGLMGYEAQVAGLTDNNPFTKWMNPVKDAIKKRSIPDVCKRRAEIVSLLKNRGISLELFNGGGTGSIKTTPSDDPITEVTAGSGFFCPHLFDYYNQLHLIPAAFFALQTVRYPALGMITCQGGGYIASGESHVDKQPIPWLPKGLKMVSMEGAGETQTPLILPKGMPRPALGAPVLFRHAKAGELAERFNEFLCIQDGKVTGSHRTYRGYGKCFL